MLTRIMLQKWARYATGALAIFALIPLVSCTGLGSKMSRRLGSTVSFDVEIAPNLNRDFPLAVNVVVVYDKTLFDELGSFSASTWFAQREQYLQNHEPARIESHYWEWVPGAGIDIPGPGVQHLDVRLGAVGAVVFANYFNPGTHRLVIKPLRTFTLRLGETSAEIEARPRR